MTPDEKYQLALQAKEIWYEGTRRGRVKPTSKQKDVLLDAYWRGVLPKDRDYSVYQWVEDNFPTII